MRAAGNIRDDSNRHAQHGDLTQAVQVPHCHAHEDATAVLVAVRLGNIYAKMARSDCGRAELTATVARVPESTEIQGALKALR